MRVPVAEAAKRIEERGLLRRAKRDDSDRIIEYVRSHLGQDLPEDLADFYRERIDWVGDFSSITPVWNDWVGWRPMEFEITGLLHTKSVPLFWDGCASIYGLDLSGQGAIPAVYFFDKDDLYRYPRYAAGSSLGTFLLLLADHDRAYHEGWPTAWQLKIDPDIDRCPRARALWTAI